MSLQLNRRSDFLEKLSKYYSSLLARLVRLTRDATVAEDVLQEAIARFWKSMERNGWPIFENGDLAYLWVTCKNVFRDRLRDRNTSLLSIEDDRVASEVERTHMKNDDLVDRLAEGDEAKRLLEKLPKAVWKDFTAEEFQILWCYTVRELSFVEIGEELGKSSAYVRRQWSRVSARLRDRIRRINPNRKLD